MPTCTHIMGNVLEKLLGVQDKKSVNDYINLEQFCDQPTTPLNTTQTHVCIATIQNNTDTLEVKDELYDGNIVVATITPTIENTTKERILNQLKKSIEDISGDIVQRTEHEFILTPTQIHISRQKIGTQ